MQELERRICPWMDILGQCREHIAEDAKVGMRIKYGIEQAIYHLRSAVNNWVAFANSVLAICPSDQLKLS